MQRIFHRALVRAAALALVGLILLSLPGCGCSSCDETYWGNVFVDNLTDLYPPAEEVLSFEIGVVGDVLSGNLLIGTLPPASTQFVGTFSENVYDAVSALSITNEIWWYGVWVGGGNDIYFEVGL